VAFAIGCEAADVSKEDADSLFGAVEIEMTGVCEQPVAHAWSDDTPKSLADAFTLGFEMTALGQVFEIDGSAFGGKIGIAQRGAGKTKVDIATCFYSRGNFGADGLSSSARAFWVGFSS
jgi:hypothetical protein